MNVILLYNDRDGKLLLEGVYTVKESRHFHYYLYRRPRAAEWR